MKPYFILILISLITSISLAQTKEDDISGCIDSIIVRDTIHVRGTILYTDGKPVEDVIINTSLYPYTQSAITDRSGDFLLEYVRPKDTLYIAAPNYRTKIINTGSRYLKIFIPDFDPHKQAITGITIESNKVSKKKSDNIKLFNSCSCCFSSIEVLPEYPGGITNLKKFISKNLVYPKQALKANIEGTVTIKFVIGKDGIAKDFEVAAGIGYGCDAEAIRVLKQMSKWHPAIMQGRPQEWDKSVSIEFKMREQ